MYFLIYLVIPLKYMLKPTEEQKKKEKKRKTVCFCACGKKQDHYRGIFLTLLHCFLYACISDYRQHFIIYSCKQKVVNSCLSYFRHVCNKCEYMDCTAFKHQSKSLQFNINCWDNTFMYMIVWNHAPLV